MLRFLPKSCLRLRKPATSGRMYSAGPAAAIASSSAPFPSMIKSLQNQPLTQVSTLSNGIRVASEYTGGETATVGVWWDTGSRYETEEMSGVAHFLEHLLFKGTERRRTHDVLEKEVEDMGAHLNAYTSRETTTFYAKTFKKDVHQGLDILADILQNSRIEASAVDREKSTIIRESEEVDKNMEEVVFDRLHETAFRKTPLSRIILGTEEHLNNMTREKLIQYRDAQLVGPRLVIAGAGAIQHDELVKMTNDLFGRIPATGQQLIKEPAMFTGSSIRCRFDDMDQLHVALAWPTVGWSDPDTYTLMVMQALLGSYNGEVENPYSLSNLVSAYSSEDIGRGFNTFNCQYSDMGLWGVYYQTHATRANRGSWYVLEEIRRLTYDVNPQALHNAKANLIASMAGALDGTTPRCEEIGRQVLTVGRRIHPLEAVQRVLAVDEGAINACAKRYLWDRDFAIAGVGPTWELPDYNWMRRRTYASRF